ncbi:MAG: hypothetical protein HUU43_17735 [Ignavibacteriaceae bacterium]|nr:hypothetical protein [Ignavibacteriaceae bacterium]
MKKTITLAEFNRFSRFAESYSTRSNKSFRFETGSVKIMGANRSASNCTAEFVPAERIHPFSFIIMDDYILLPNAADITSFDYLKEVQPPEELIKKIFNKEFNFALALSQSKFNYFSKFSIFEVSLPVIGWRYEEKLEIHLPIFRNEESRVYYKNNRGIQTLVVSQQWDILSEIKLYPSLPWEEWYVTEYRIFEGKIRALYPASEVYSFTEVSVEGIKYKYLNGYKGFWPYEGQEEIETHIISQEQIGVCKTLDAITI